MSLTAVRVAIARENLDDSLVPLTEEETLMVAPPDEVADDTDVAAAIHEDAGATSAEDIGELLDAGTVISDVIETVRAEGEEIAPGTVVAAQERLNQVARRVGLPTRAVSRERLKTARESNSVAPNAPDTDDVAEHDISGPYSEAQDLIKDAEKNLEYIAVAATEGLREMAARLATNTQNFFKWRTTYIKDVRAVAAAAARVTGAPKQGAAYANKVRIAHFTNGEGKALTTARELNDAFASSAKAAVACRMLQKQMENVFVFFNKGSGKVDLASLANAFEPSHGKLEGALSLSGAAAIFGEEFVMTGFRPQGTSDNQEQLLQAFADVRYQKINHWTVGSLEITPLPAMAAKDVAANANALSSLASGLKQDYDILDSLADYTNGESDVGNEILRGLSSPKLYLRFRNVVLRTIAAMAAAGEVNIDLKAKALNCVLDYYKWSLKCHSATATESADSLEPATEGLAGGLMGFLVGGALGPVWGALSHGRGGQLRRQIKDIAERIDDLKAGDAERALKDGKLKQEDYDKIIKMDWKDIITGAVGGGLFWGLFGAIASSRTENAQKEMEKKLKELNDLVRQEQAAQKRGKDEA